MLQPFNFVGNAALHYCKYLEWQICFDDLGQWFLNLEGYWA